MYEVGQKVNEKHLHDFSAHYIIYEASFLLKLSAFEVENKTFYW